MANNHRELEEELDHESERADLYRARFNRSVTLVNKLKASLRWALEYIDDGTTTEEDPIPKHDCDYYNNPESGDRSFHQDYMTARELLDA